MRQASADRASPPRPDRRGRGASTMPVLNESSARAEPAPVRWRLVLLGLPRLVREEPAASRPLSPKDAALLAIVALDGPVAADRVAALVWPSVDARKADTSLRQRLYRLRRECGTGLV